MGSVQVPLAPDLIGFLQSLNRPLADSVRALIVTELYRRGRISSGKAAELTGEEWQAELEQIRSL